MDVFLIRLAFGDKKTGTTLSGQILRNFDSQIVPAREETAPAIGIAPPGASGRAHPLDHVWIVGDDNLAGNPPMDWRKVELKKDNIGNLFNSLTLTDEAKLASGLVLQLAAAEPVRIELTQIENVDVVFVVAGVDSTTKLGGTPPPWLTLTLRRLRLRGRVRVVTGQVWERILRQEDANERKGQLFPEVGENANCWTRILDRPLPLDILRIESTAAKPLRWPAADKNSSLPFRTAQPFVAPAKASCRISFAEKRYGFDLKANNAAFDNVVRKDMVARNERLNGESLAIIIHVAGDTIAAPKNPDWKSYELRDDALSKVNRQDGIEQIIEIDRFGRVTLTHLDSFDRPVPCSEPNKDKVCRLSLDLGNVLFPGLPREYPVELARISYNGEPSDLGPDEAEDRTREVPLQKGDPPGRPLEFLFGDRNETIRAVWAKIKDVGSSTRIEGPKREALRLLDHPDPLLNALREKVDKWTGGDTHSYEAIKNEIKRQAQNPDSKSISDDALNELLQLVPVEMPDYRAAIESLVRRFK